MDNRNDHLRLVPPANERDDAPPDGRLIDPASGEWGFGEFNQNDFDTAVLQLQAAQELSLGVRLRNEWQEVGDDELELRWIVQVAQHPDGGEPENAPDDAQALA
jgi:hypothetical protein